MKKSILLLFLVFTKILWSQVANQPNDLVVCDDDSDGIFCVMLSVQNAQVLGSQDPANYTISYHATQADADANINVLSVNSYCNTTAAETIYVRLEEASNGMFDTTNFQFIVNPKPVVPPSVEIDLYGCDSSLNPDGIAVFDLSLNAQFIYGTHSPSDHTLQYFETEADANANINPIVNLTSYTNTTPNQAIYVRLTNNITGCFTVGFFYLFVEATDYTLTEPTPLELCTENTDETAVFDLTERASEITNGNNAIALRYFMSQEDLENYSEMNDTSIVFPTHFTNTTNPQIIYIRAIPPSSGIFTCATDVTLTLRTIAAPITPEVITPILTCDSDNDGAITVDLSSRETEIINGNSNVVVSYHTSFSNAYDGINPILNPTNYSIQTSDLSAAGDQILYVRLESTVQITNAGEPCFDTGGLRIVDTKPLFSNISYDYYECTTNANGIATFNFDDITNNIDFLNNSQIAGDFVISYHLSENDVIANSNPLTNGFQNTTNPQVVFVRAENSTTGCAELTNIPALILHTDSPVIIESLTPLVKCEPNGNTFSLFTLFNTAQEIRQGRPLTVTFHETLGEAESGDNPFSNNLYTNTVPNAQTIYVRVENENGCYITTTLDLIVVNDCLPSSYIFGSYICDDDLDGLGCFDLTTRLPEILAGTDPNSVIVSYHLSQEDAFFNTNAISNPTTFCTTEVDNVIHVRVQEIATGNAYGRIFTLEGLVIDSISPTPLEACDEDGDGITGFLLSDKTAEITGGNTKYNVRYYETEADAIANINVLNEVYFNTIPNSQTIYAKVARIQLFQTPVDCHKIVPLELVPTTAYCTDGNYEVTTIPHVMYNFDATATSNLDDTFSNAKSMPFEFDFFGEAYNEFVIGTNGVISFNTLNANSACDWQLNSSHTIPSTELYTNSIFGIYHDLNNAADGSLGYGIVGEAPFRKMIIFFDEIDQYASSCVDPSTTQIVLYETLNIIDIQVAQKLACTDWNGGLAVLGIQGRNGFDGYAPVDRNMGVWDAIQEGYRFKPVTTYENVSVVTCDDNENGYFTFDLTTYEASVLGDVTTGTITYFYSEEDAINNSNALPTTYVNTQNAQVIYARILNTITNEVDIKTVTLAVINCAMDTDADGVATLDEDINMDGNLGNDDTDGDGIPDFIDEDDDGDFILTNLELINTATGLPESGFLDTDGDMIPNHRDNDDDGDGTLTIDEDYNGNNNPEDDDTNNNGIPDYLDAEVFLSVNEFTAIEIRMYPNPAKDKITIGAAANMRIQNIQIYSVEGRLVHVQNQEIAVNNTVVDVSDLSSGFYIVKVQTADKQTYTKQIIVE